MTANFESAFMKVQRAQEHWQDLCDADEYFWNRHGEDELILTRDPSGLYRVVLGLNYPSEYVSCIIGDIIHNLRSALDHVVIELIKLNGKKPDRNSAFPIGSNKEHFLAAVETKTKGASAKAVAMIQTMEPEATPSGYIWGIHKLDVTDKHKTILTMATVHSIKGLRAKYRQRYMPIPSLVIGHDAPSAPFRLPVPANIDEREVGLSKRFEASRLIVFGKGQPFAGESVIRTSLQLLERIERAVGHFSNSFMRTIPFQGIV